MLTNIIYVIHACFHSTLNCKFDYYNSQITVYLYSKSNKFSFILPPPKSTHHLKLPSAAPACQALSRDRQSTHMCHRLAESKVKLTAGQSSSYRQPTRVALLPAIIHYTKRGASSRIRDARALSRWKAAASRYLYKRAFFAPRVAFFYAAIYYTERECQSASMHI